MRACPIRPSALSRNHRQSSQLDTWDALEDWAVHAAFGSDNVLIYDDWLFDEHWSWHDTHHLITRDLTPEGETGHLRTCALSTVT